MQVCRERGRTRSGDTFGAIVQDVLVSAMARRSTNTAKVSARTADPRAVWTATVTAE